jgi:hypothetical protein
VNCISPGEYEKFWILGLALDEPGNVWGIKQPPEDWNEDTPTTEGDSASGDHLYRTARRRIKDLGKATGKGKFLLRMFRQFTTHQGF